MINMSDDKYFILLRKAVVDAEDNLWEAVNGACPGDHLPVQHRDGKPPWCKNCGRDNQGNLHKDVT